MSPDAKGIQKFNCLRTKFVSDFFQHKLICSRMLDEMRDKGIKSYGTAMSLLEVESATQAYIVTHPDADKFAEIELEFVKRVAIHRVVTIGFGGIYESQDGSHIQTDQLANSYEKLFDRARECVKLIDEIYGVERNPSKTSTINVRELLKIININ